ncbi:MAG: lipoyl(octanoyl) transferase LipB [Pseudomonadota bacterium]
MHDTPVEWVISPERVDYAHAVDIMEKRVAAIHAGRAGELVWLLEHEPLFTAGTSAKPEDLLNKDMFPVHHASRGGQYTYHGPGQRVAYVMLDLTRRGRDVRAFVHQLEEWLIQTLAAFGVDGERRADRVGVWVDRTAPGGVKREDKIAAIGVRVRRWVTFHGVALNVEPDLSHFQGITPCGIAAPEFGVTSLVDLGRTATMLEVDGALHEGFEAVFGPAGAPTAKSAADIARENDPEETDTGATIKAL